MNSLPSFSVITPPAISITGPGVWVLFVFITAIWAISALILEYHWKNYGMDAAKISRARFLFRIGSAFLLSIIFLGTLSFSFS